MPQKIRDLRNMLLLEPGSTYISGKGDRAIWFHPLLSGTISLLGNNENSTKPYQKKMLEMYFRS